MKQIKARIEGKTPLLLHRFTDEDQMSATSGQRTSTNGDRGTPKEQAELSLYKNDEGIIIMPQPNLYRCILDAGKFFKSGKSKVTTQKSSIIPAAVMMDETYYEIQHKEPWEVDIRPVRIPSTGGRILRYRPVFHDWAIDFDMTLDENIIGIKLLRDIVDTAGNSIGLGDFRPDCKGPFGRFKVTKWEVTEED